MLRRSAHSVKLEGGVDVAETVQGLTRAGIPVMGHIGLTPQHVHAMGGFKVQEKTKKVPVESSNVASVKPVYSASS